MTYDDLVDHFGGESKAATAIGYDRQRVHAWKGRPRIPTDAQIAYEIATGGALRADVPAEFRASDQAAA
jgi:hypothetical protein